MKKIDIDFYSYRPRLKVGLTWDTDIVPCVGDIIEIHAKYISEWDKKYFYQWSKNYSRSFKVKERKFILDKSKYHYNVGTIKITLDWTDEEQEEVNKYLENYKKERGKKKIKEKD